MPPKKVVSKKFPKGYGWRIDICIKGTPRIRQTFESRSVAQEIEDGLRLNAARRRFGLPTDSRVTLAELIDRHVRGALSRRPKGKWIEGILRRFEQLTGAARQVETIKTADLNDYAQLRYDAGLKPQSINRELVEIKSCLTAAATYFSTLEDYRSPRAPWQQEPTDGRRQTWSPEQVHAVLGELYGERRATEQQWHYESRVAVGDMFNVALQTGMRAGEVRKLRKIDLHLGKRVIIISSKKGMSRHRTGRAREIPMTDEVSEILKRRAEATESEWIFPNRYDTGPRTDHLRAFKTACARAGIPYGLTDNGTLIFNDARRTALNEMLDAGHSPRAVGDIMGHGSETMAKHYARSTVESRRAAVEATRQGEPRKTDEA